MSNSFGVVHQDEAVGEQNLYKRENVSSNFKEFQTVRELHQKKKNSWPVSKPENGFLLLFTYQLTDQFLLPGAVMFLSLKVGINRLECLD